MIFLWARLILHIIFPRLSVLAWSSSVKLSEVVHPYVGFGQVLSPRFKTTLKRTQLRLFMFLIRWPVTHYWFAVDRDSRARVVRSNFRKIRSRSYWDQMLLVQTTHDHQTFHSRPSSSELGSAPSNSTNYAEMPFMLRSISPPWFGYARLRPRISWGSPCHSRAALKERSM